MFHFYDELMMITPHQLYGSNKIGEFPNATDINNNGVIEPGPSTYVNNTLVSVNREDGIYYPALIMKKYGYSYLYQENGDIQTLINANIQLFNVNFIK